MTATATSTASPAATERRAGVVVRGMYGLGDNVYQRPFVRAQFARFDTVWLETPWPELYRDIAAAHDLRFVRSEDRLRTQTKHARSVAPSVWSEPPGEVRRIQAAYGWLGLAAHQTIIRSLEAVWGLYGEPFDFRLPTDPAWPRTHRPRPIAVIRPATVRREWKSPSRNPRQEYLQAIADELAPTHHVISLADLQDGEEWLDGPPLERVHERLERGELGLEAMLGLIASADVVVGGVGFIAPLGIALGVRTFIVHGGRGAHNAPEVITDPRMDLSRFGWVLPDRFCRCSEAEHGCDKTIDRGRLVETFRSFMEATRG